MFNYLIVYGILLITSIDVKQMELSLLLNKSESGRGLLANIKFKKKKKRWLNVRSILNIFAPSSWLEQILSHLKCSVYIWSVISGF